MYVTGIHVSDHKTSPVLSIYTHLPQALVPLARLSLSLGKTSRYLHKFNSNVREVQTQQKQTRQLAAVQRKCAHLADLLATASRQLNSPT